MAINSNCVVGDKNPVRSLCSSKTSNISSCRLIKINFAGKDSCCSSRAHGPNINKELKSPYFTNDKVQVLSRVTAKKVIDRKPNEFTSSFPLAASVYKANSDEFKLKKQGNHKVKKSVLTLPNEPVLMPKTYTVSDLNDSEYFNAVNESRTNKTKKRRSVKRIKKSREKEPAMEFCDRDARYCSQLNIDLDCSSSEIVNFTGDGERISRMSYKTNNSVKAGNPPDVWAVLRNINKFQFRPSPPESQQNIPLRKRRPIIRKGNNSNDARIIETCRTEEFAYISSFEVDSKTRESCSPSSSFDRVTVIDKQSEQDEIMQQFSRNIFGSNLNFGEKINSNIKNHSRGRNKRRLKNSNKKESHAKKKAENPHQCLENKNRTPQLEGEKAITEDSNVLLPEPASKTSSIFKRIENCSDNSSIKENDSASNDQTNKCQKEVRCNKMKFLSKSPNRLKTLKPTGDSEKQLNGITKVILSKGKEIEPEKLSETPRKPRLALTLPNNNIPKLSRLEIKRRIANQKYPIIILGKDQVTNRGIYVPNVDPPQFDGVDKHIWPFMLEWSGKNLTGNIQNIHQKETMKSQKSKLKNKLNLPDNNTNHDSNMTTNVSSNLVGSKKVECKKKKNDIVSIINNKIQLVTEVSPHVLQKHKPLIHLKNKMFHFLHKNPSTPKHGNEWSSDRQIEILLKDKQVGTNETTKNHNNLHNKYSLSGLHNKEVPDKPIENRIVPKAYSPLRHPWAKGKWASDFIDNIIKKIRSGVYYGVDRKENKLTSNGTEVSTQTEINVSKNAYCQNGPDFDFESNSTLKKDDPLKNIPGFDQSLSTLEIETISTNKIAVKHCITNVVVHFDIQVLGEAKNITHTNKSMSCIPVDVQNNQEKVFKCNTSIMNAVLPAELCTIIPTMMQNIIDSENRLLLQPTTMENVQSQLTPLLEFIEPESPKLNVKPLLGWVMSDEVRPFLNGRFRSSCPDYKNVSGDLHYSTDSINSAVILTPRVNTQIFCQYNPLSLNLHITVCSSNTFEKPNEEANTSHNNCRVLQPYNHKTWSIVPYRTLNVADFLKQIIDNLNVNKLINIHTISNALRCSNINIFISKPSFILRDESQDIISLPRSGNKVGVISLFNAFKKSIPNNNEETGRSLNCTETNNDQKKDKSRIQFDDNKTVPRKKVHPIKVLRKKSYVRFYRKCNSMSSISSYKSTPLNRVTNLEEFCQVLGSNIFCNVLDGCLEKKIMSAVEEMKNWITDINSKQALLILLLTNKKDTPNLIRFRPVLLQGIAVNRITKADELDTEIEVIERENFKLSQYEGISYLPASPKNQDNLLEELYWIAKTTASDYQKTFDESSEKLLKSLLEKRKKLNPSYLRVMARYVGLGLLAPTKS